MPSTVRPHVVCVICDIFRKHRRHRPGAADQYRKLRSSRGFDPPQLGTRIMGIPGQRLNGQVQMDYRSTGPVYVLGVPLGILTAEA